MVQSNYSFDIFSFWKGHIKPGKYIILVAHKEVYILYKI